MTRLEAIAYLIHIWNAAADEWSEGTTRQEEPRLAEALKAIGVTDDERAAAEEMANQIP